MKWYPLITTLQSLSLGSPFSLKTFQLFLLYHRLCVLIYGLLYLIILIWVAHSIFFPLILSYGVLLSFSQTPLPFSHDDSFKPMGFSYSYTMAILRASSWEHNTFSLTFLWQFMDKSLLLAQQLNLVLLNQPPWSQTSCWFFGHLMAFSNQMQINLVFYSFLDVSYKYLELDPWWLFNPHTISTEVQWVGTAWWNSIPSPF